MSAEVTTFCHLTFYFPAVNSRLQKAVTVARELKATHLNYSASLAGGHLVLSGALLMAYSVESDTMGNSQVHHHHSAFRMNSTLSPLAWYFFCSGIFESDPRFEMRTPQLLNIKTAKLV